ncbi:sugar-phosphatase [Streptococcus sp. DD13]|uniref:sugar-phosphatase n=1 Tax=Streptococcus sp. DD13 TaxID=1777881 RepID=UPI000796C1A9|nr:sugar-phosphatase [Streptococcus sp. DD13]KXT78570.1 Promiscuous sugar phosphatase YidA, haloacid dehalogenase-like phosphatase family [Streptococcus sp. DD13]
MPIKLIAIDIDGTLLNSQKEITPAVFEAIQEAKKAGVKVVLATGRPLSGIQNLLTELQLREPGDYAITFNGGLVLDVATGDIISQATLTYEEFMDIQTIAQKLDIPMHASTKEGIYTANRNLGKYTIYESVLVNAPIFYRTTEEMRDIEIIKTMLVDEPEKLDALIPLIPEDLKKRFNAGKSADFYYEICPKEGNKGYAIQQLAKKLGLSMDQTMAIGDQENDRPMLEVVGHPVVMENGNPKTKEIAKSITKSNDEDGVAYAIRKWVL